MHQVRSFSQGPTLPADLQAAQEFLAFHGEALSNAAELLGGDRWRSRAMRLQAAVAEARTLSRALREGLVAFHHLLTLRFTADPQSEEAARFAAIDPDDAVVTDLCLLADRLFDLLQSIASDEITGVPAGNRAA